MKRARDTFHPRTAEAAAKWLAEQLEARGLPERIDLRWPKVASEKVRAAKTVNRVTKQLRRTNRTAETKAIKAAVFARSGGLCDYCQKAPATDLEHPFGRGRGRPAQSLETCLATCRPCHIERTDLVGGAVLWWGRIADTFQRYGCSWSAWKANEVKKLHEAKDALPAAPQLGKAVDRG